MYPNAAKNLRRMTSIDGLRGLAALAVLGYHARSTFWVGTKQNVQEYGLSFNLDSWCGYLTLPFSPGGLGIILFFVLSGYCIHRRGARQIAADQGAVIQYSRFYSRRFWRIYPTYVAALLCTAFIDYWVQGKTGLTPGQDNSLYAFLISLVALQGYFAPCFGSNGVFWTLAMEIHLYLAYPLLFLISRKYVPNRVILVTLLAGLFYFSVDAIWDIEGAIGYRQNETPVFLPYWFAWATGFYIAEIEADRVSDLSDFTWVVLMVTGFTAGFSLHINGYTTFSNIPWALFFAGVLRLSFKKNGERMWSSVLGRALAFVGIFSYSLYAIHVPFFEALGVLLEPITQESKFVSIWPAICVALLSLPIGYLFYRSVEYWSVRSQGSTSSSS